MAHTPANTPSEAEISRSTSPQASSSAPLDESDPIALPVHVAGSGTLDRLVDTARDYARAATAENTNRAYAADWAHFARWCRLKGTDPLPPSPEMIGLYLADLASGTGPSPSMVAAADARCF